MKLLKGWVQYERAAVFMQDGAAWEVGNTPDPAYTVKQVDADTFRRDLHSDLLERDFSWAFKRGDICVASYFNNQIIGWDISASASTPVNDRVMFEIPEGYFYSYASFTHKDHRGLGLADQRSAWWDWNGYGKDEAGTSIWYIETSNKASMAAFGSHHDDVAQIGYTGFLTLGPWTFCWRDRNLRDIGAGFVTVEKQN